MSIFGYAFMRVAFIAGTMVAITVPLVGSTMVFKRMSLMGEALSHVSLAGVALGLIFGYDPILGALAASVIAALSIEVIRNRLKTYSELSLAVIMSFGIGLAGVLMGFVNNPANFNNFLFGSVLAISQNELMLSIGLCLLVLVLSLVFYRQFFYISFDETSAKVSKINTNTFNMLFTFMTAIVVSITSRIVGALIVSSLMVIPVTAGMQISKGYRSTLLWSILFSISSIWIGLFVAFYAPWGLRPGGTIVLVSVFELLVVLIVKGIASKRGIHHTV
ncbi:metal ABC transporter permease [Erysipelothrix larvae]|uniref:Metal ABC transporter permease n=1 Tax=Erysipelothrix larvae TaxID=1514105 RepID=A0A109UGY2_9FIRM|nr:metal ABC transporter permease [Erysipelothrix larvae]AMC93268.1 metal ABC transporter permease [Erysipelothrix larvae]